MRQHVVSSFDALNRASNYLYPLFSPLTLTSGPSSITVITPSTSKRYNVVVNRKSLTSGWWWWKNTAKSFSQRSLGVRPFFHRTTKENIERTSEITDFVVFKNPNSYDGRIVYNVDNVDETSVTKRVINDRRCECIECKVFPSAISPYPAHGHFYHQQQHHFCYDNTNAYGAGAYGIGGGLGGAPVSDAIEANASRYNRLPPAYPTDYVYNPKEARLRKAMREQSRELSRQTILQTAIASATGNANVGGPRCGSNGVSANLSPSSAMGATNFLNHPLNCSASAVAGSSIAAATVSSLPGSPSFNAGNRIVNPWFAATHGPSANHLKPILSPRVMTVAQHQQQQHRTFDKTKEVLRKQAECAGVGGFSEASNSAYSPDFSANRNPGNLSGHQSSSREPSDYCVIAEFSDGQKWHPYQNGPSPYYSRTGGTLTKMGALHPSMQSTNPHAHTGWNQFCTVPLSTVSRAPRHMLFLQEQQQNQHCGFPDEEQIPYVQNKHVEIGHRLRTSYSQQDHQSKLQSSSMSPLNMSQLREPEKAPIEDAPRWGTANGPPSTSTNENSIGSMMMRARRERESKMNQEQEHDQARAQDCRQQSKNRERDQQQRYSEGTSSSGETIKHLKSGTSISKQPLPGFHQAFGSTEIGRFSRSEFFANMVGDGGNLIPDGFLSASLFPFSPNSQLGASNDKSLGFPHLKSEDEILQQVLPDDCIWIAPIPAHNAVSNMVDGKATFAAFFDYSQRLNQQDWLHATGNALVEQPSGAFLLRENNCALMSSREQHERPEYSEINCSGSSSVNYTIRENRSFHNYREKIIKSKDEEIVEPENLSSRSNEANHSPTAGKSTIPTEKS